MSTYNCADYLHNGEQTPAAWYVQAAKGDTGSDGVVPQGVGIAAAVCDAHLADAVRFCMQQGDGGRVIIRRENADTTSIEESVL